MQVRDVMGPVVGTASPGDLLRDASERMKALDVDPLPVTENGRVVGMLDRAGIDRHVQEAGISAGLARVSEIMSRHVTCCSPDEPIHDALARLEEKDSTSDRVPVVDGSGRLVGIVSCRKLRERDAASEDGVTAVQAVEAVDQLVEYGDDRVDYMSDSSFPASDPPAFDRDDSSADDTAP